MSGDDGFLSRWSKRKKAVAEADAIEQENAAAAGPEDEASGEAGGDEALTDEQILEKYGLKDPDQMEEGDDFSGFMRAAIPEHLRRRALRKLWVSNPVLANLDGLNDYDGDWTGGSVPAGEQLKTAYEVGAGYLKKLAEAPGEEAAREQAADAPEPVREEATAEPRETQSAAAPEGGDEAPDTQDETPQMSEEQDRLVRRRMAFRVPSR